MIGYEHYISSIHNIQINQKENKKISWIDIFLNDNIYIPEFLNFFIIESRIPNSWYLQRL